MPKFTTEFENVPDTFQPKGGARHADRKEEVEMGERSPTHNAGEPEQGKRERDNRKFSPKNPSRKVDKADDDILENIPPQRGEKEWIEKTQEQSSSPKNPFRG